MNKRGDSRSSGVNVPRTHERLEVFYFATQKMVGKHNRPFHFHPLGRFIEMLLLPLLPNKMNFIHVLCYFIVLLKQTMRIYLFTHWFVTLRFVFIGFGLVLSHSIGVNRPLPFL